MVVLFVSGFALVGATVTLTKGIAVVVAVGVDVVAAGVVGVDAAAVAVAAAAACKSMDVGVVEDAVTVGHPSPPAAMSDDDDGHLGVVRSHQIGLSEWSTIMLSWLHQAVDRSVRAIG